VARIKKRLTAIFLVSVKFASWAENPFYWLKEKKKKKRRENKSEENKLAVAVRCGSAIKAISSHLSSRLLHSLFPFIFLFFGWGATHSPLWQLPRSLTGFV